MKRLMSAIRIEADTRESLQFLINWLGSGRFYFFASKFRRGYDLAARVLVRQMPG
jgi:hypothetical protein